MLTKKPATLLIFLSILVSLSLLSGCERPATQSNWSPIDSAKTAENATSLPETLTAPPGTVELSTTEPQPIGTLDFSTLPETLPRSMKGYDLYSWQTGEVWNFTLITGTNRTKSFEEIITPVNSVSADGFVDVSVTGVEALKELFKRLPPGEAILWGGMDLSGQVAAGTVYLTFPPQSMLDEMKAYCTSLGLSLTSLKEQ
jgi:hypothetical protein